jgi:hypothetical protein
MTLARAAITATMAAMANPTSSPLTVAEEDAPLGGAARRAGAEAGAGRWATGAEEARGAAAAGAAPAATGGAAGALEAPVGPPGGSVGSLIVGAAVGLGGRLIRTVSFLG